MRTMLLLTLAALAAGCAAPAPAAEDTETLAPAEAPAAAMEPTAPAVVVEESALAPMPEEAARADAPPEVVLLDLMMEGGTEVALPEGGAGTGGPWLEFSLARGPPAGATMVVLWEAESAPRSEMEFTLRAGDLEVARAESRSPIVLEVPGRAFGPAGTRLTASLWPAGAGVYLDEPARLILTLAYEGS